MKEYGPGPHCERHRRPSRIQECGALGGFRVGLIATLLREILA